MTMRGSGRLFRQPGSPFWWCSVYYGKEHREVCRDRKTGERLPATEENRKEAEKYLQERREQVIGEKRGGAAFIAPSMARITVDELLNDLVTEYKKGGRRGVPREVSPQMACQLKTLREHFGSRRAASITSKHLEDFKAALLSENKKPATINRLLSFLAQAFKIAATSTPRKIAYPLHVQLLSEDNTRKGKLEPQQVAQLAAALPPQLSDMMLFGYETGARAGEILKLKWSYLDGDGISVPAQDTKNRKARTIAMTPELEEIIIRRRAARVPGYDLIFHRNGRPINNYRKPWVKACVALGLGRLDEKGKYSGPIFHDLRRSACHEMWKSGSTKEDCMEVSGHATAHMFDRYKDLFSEEEKRARQRAVQQKRHEWKEQQLAAQPSASAVVN